MTATLDLPEGVTTPLRPPRVMGLDLSLTGTGIAHSYGWTQLIVSEGSNKDPVPVCWDRILFMRNAILDLLLVPEPLDLIVIEGMYESGNGHMRDRAGLWWQIVGKLLQGGEPVAFVNPMTRVVYATGNGRSKKQEVYGQAIRRLGDHWTDVANDNTADAAWLCAMGADYLGQPIAPMPKTHRRALESVQWPARPSDD